MTESKNFHAQNFSLDDISWLSGLTEQDSRWAIKVCVIVFTQSTDQIFINGQHVPGSVRYCETTKEASQLIYYRR